jgi:hypothetical protein
MSGIGKMTLAHKYRNVFRPLTSYGQGSYTELAWPISRNKPGAEETYAINFSYVLHAGFLSELFLDL